MRFPEFSGEWEYKCLGEIGQSLIGLTYSPSDVVKEGGTIVFRSSNIQNGVIDYGDIVRVSKKIKDSIITRDGDLLICARNGSTRLIGKNAILKKSDEGQTFGAFMMVFRSDENRFVHQLLSTKAYSTQVSENLGARINQITTRNFAEYTFGMPCTHGEKEKIGAFLELINERIETQSKIIEEQETLLKSLADKLFSTFDTDTKLHLGDIAELYQPKTISLSNLSSKGYPVYGANGIIGSYNKFNHMTEQICIACRGSSCGSVNYTVPKAWITGNAMVVNTDNYSNIIDKRYLYYYLRRINYSSLISGSGQPQIVRAPLAKLVIPVPTLEKQKHEVIILDTVGQMLETNKIILQYYQNQKAYLLSRMFI